MSLHDGLHILGVGGSGILECFVGSAWKSSPFLSYMTSMYIVVKQEILFYMITHASNNQADTYSKDSKIWKFVVLRSRCKSSIHQFTG